MKFLQIFNKTPNHKKFSYNPRFYDAQEEERKERQLRIEKELANLKDTKVLEPDSPSRQRIAGSFRQSKKTATVQADPSANLLRLVILLVLSLGFIAYLQFGPVALYGVAFVFVPFYLYLKFRKLKK